MLTTEEIHDVAELARIELSQDEAQKLQNDMGHILDFFEALQTLDTKTVAPIGHITGRENNKRADVVNEASTATRLRIRENFPESSDGYLKVRSVF